MRYAILVPTIEDAAGEQGIGHVVGAGGDALAQPGDTLSADRWRLPDGLVRTDEVAVGERQEGLRIAG